MTIAVIISTNSRLERQFTKYFNCIPLRVGCFILGYISLIINTYHTLLLVTFTTFLGAYTHGFDHIDAELITSTYDNVTDVKAVQRPLFTQIGILLMIVIVANILWIIINTACLVGLHKRRTGPVWVYISFASFRLLISITSFLHMVKSGTAQTDTIITFGIDLALAAYFVLVYYAYAVQLERENAEIMQGSEVQVQILPLST